MKFVSLSQLLRWPLFGSNSGLFKVPDFIVSLVGVKKKKKEEGRKKRYKGKERRIKQERREERKKVLKEKNNKELV